MSVKKFHPLKVSSKFAICGLPLRLDSYNFCSFGCGYCYSNNRMIGQRDEDSIPNTDWLGKKFSKVFDAKDVNKRNFLEVLLSKRITLHGGSHCDFFQPCEEELGYSKFIVGMCNDYDLNILFSTKGSSTYDVPVNPSLHSFQLSFSGVEDTLGLECNVAPFNGRYNFYKDLVDKGFDVGIRIQPFIPNVTNVEELVDKFDDAVHFTLESIKFVPGFEGNDSLMEKMGLCKGDFTNLGLLHLKPVVRYNLYSDIIDLFEDRGCSWSIADNDLHYLGNNKCCCGDLLVDEVAHFNNTELLHCKGLNYSLDDVFESAEDFLDCRCSSLFNSDRRNGCVTVRDFFEDRFDRESSVFSPRFQYSSVQSTLL